MKAYWQIWWRENVEVSFDCFCFLIETKSKFVMLLGQYKDCSLSERDLSERIREEMPKIWGNRKFKWLGKCNTLLGSTEGLLGLCGHKYQTRPNSMLPWFLKIMISCLDANTSRWVIEFNQNYRFSKRIRLKAKRVMAVDGLQRCAYNVGPQNLC